ncbi:MAG: serine/threonine-protein kinase [Calothrix sp. MO_167.B12]|nr:serine/threonine-protein kinase [Calothrix sp. MO_167.B12]
MLGKTLGGRYKIFQQIGEGGFGVTFLAEDIQRPGNPVCVVKLFRPQTNDSHTLTAGKILFNREAETLERLGIHDQIPRLLAHLQEDRQFYLVQEFIEGYDISQELPPQGNLLSETQVIHLLIEILEVLSFVHQQQVIHRDIKPSNIRRRQLDGKIVLIDFGAVKQISTQIVNPQGQTSFTVAIGTRGYMPSEQANGNPQFSSDIYALGMIGIQALTGMYPHTLPCSAQTGEIDWRTQAQEDSQLADIIDTMVRYDYRQRYPTADLTLQALRSIIVPVPETVQATGPSTKPQSSVTKPPFTQPPQSTKIPKTVAIGMGISAAVIAIGIGIWSFIRPPIEEFSIYPYENLNYGFQIRYPKRWERRDINNPITGEVVEFLSPKQNENDTFQEKVTISVEGFVGTLDEFGKFSTIEINKYLKQAQIENRGDFTLAQRSGKKFIFSGRYGNHLLKNVQIFTLKRDKAYVIIYTAEKDSFHRFLPTAEAMIKSLEFTNPEESSTSGK